MPLPHACLPFSTSSAAAAAAAAACDAITELASNPSSSLRSLIPSSSSSSSSSSSPFFSASFAYLTSLQPVGPSGAGVVTAAAALASSPTSLLLYCATPSEISIYDLRGGLRPIETVAACPSAGAVKYVALLPDGRRAITAHQDGRVRVWRRSARSGRLRLAAALPTVPDRIRRLPLPGSYVRVRRHHRRLWIEHADAVSAVAAAAGDLLYSSSWDKTLKIWRAADLRCVESLKAHDDAVNAVAVGGDGKVYTGSADGSIRVWARGERRHALVATLERHASAVNALAIGGDEVGAVLYSGSNDRSILVWEKEGGAEHMAAVGALRGHEKAVLCIACVGDVVFSGSADRTVRIWRRGGGGRQHGCLGVLIGHSSAVRSITAVRTPEEEEEEAEEEYRVCSGSLDGEVRVWRVRISGLEGSDPS